MADNTTDDGGSANSLSSKIYPNTTTLPNVEAPSKDTATRVEYSYFDHNSQPVHLCKAVYKNKPLIKVYPYGYSRANGLSIKRVSEIELRGWESEEDLPKLLKPGKRISLAHKRIKPLMYILYQRYPNFRKLIVVKEGGVTRFTDSTITLSFQDLELICKAVGKEIALHESRRKTAALNALSRVSSQFAGRADKLSKGALAYLLSHYSEDVELSSADVDAILKLIAHVPFGNVSVTENFIETRNQINVAYLDEVIAQFEALMDVKTDNEKDWQRFFAEFGWILTTVFPYQVVLAAKEAYIGGKTIHNSEGRVVDFLFQNGFRDNYALLETKTHNTELIGARPFREPDAYAFHTSFSAAVSQCLDQKNVFLTEMGQKYPILDPKVVLVIGHKGRLNDNQARAFELARQNQKHVDVVTFDELLEKLIGLRRILQSKKD